MFFRITTALRGSFRKCVHLRKGLKNYMKIGGAKMSKLYPHGKVVNGEYADSNVYVWEENKSLKIIDGILNNGIFSPGYTEKCTIYASTIKAYEDMGSVSHNADPGKVGVATFWFGIGGGLLASQLGNQTVYSVIVQYDNGKLSMFQLNSFAYQNFKAIVFNVPQGIQKGKPASLANNTEISVAPPASNPTVLRNIIINENNILASLKRIELFLEEEKWNTAIDYCEAVLDIDPINAQTYVLYLLADFRIKTIDGLMNCEAFWENENYIKAIRFAESELKEKLDTFKQSAQKEFDERKTNCCKNQARISVSQHTVGLKADGTVIAVGRNDENQCNTKNWKDIVAVSAGHFYTVGLKSDGTVVATGENLKGGCDVQDWKDIVAISAGGQHTVGLKYDGTVVAVGQNDESQCNTKDWKNIVAVSAGSGYTVGLKSDGTVITAGSDNGPDANGYMVPTGKCNVQNWKDIIAIFAGSSVTIGIRSDGTVIAVGYNGEGQNNVHEWELLGSISDERRLQIKKEVEQNRILEEQRRAEEKLRYTKEEQQYCEEKGLTQSSQECPVCGQILGSNPNCMICNDLKNRTAPVQRTQLQSQQKSGCYIATAVYGSYDCPQVLVLRKFRDEILSKSRCGRAFIKMYYFFSPPLANSLKKQNV